VLRSSSPLNIGAGAIDGGRRSSSLTRAAERGSSTEQIAARLSLSPATVRNHLSNAITKAGPHADGRSEGTMKPI
jgi:DNA-binding NarL/FixJ family response regulator